MNEMHNNYEEKMIESFVNTPENPKKVIWYKKAFTKFQREGKPKMKWHWSWWGFLAGPWFLFYRKVYAIGFMFLLLILATMAIPNPMIVSILQLLIYLFLGGFSAYYIYRQYEKKKQQIEETWQTESEKVVAMQSLGGTNKIIAVLPALGVILVAVGIAVSVIIPKLSPMGDVPKCSDPETVQLVKKILNRDWEFTYFMEQNRIEDINLDTIRTVKIDDQVGMYTCKASVKPADAKKGNPFVLKGLNNVTYTVALTDDKQKYIVEILPN